MVFSSITMMAEKRARWKEIMLEMVDNIAPKKILLTINVSYYCTLPYLTYL